MIVNNNIGKSHPWFDILNGKYILNITKYFQDSPPRELNILNNLDKLQSVSYTSNGQYLNTTFWLSNPFKPIPPGTFTPSYVVYIDADSNNLTGSFGGVDYMAQIIWNNKTKNNWTYDLEEFSLIGKGHVIEKIDNYTGFFTKEPVVGNNFNLNNRTVSVPLNLNKIGPIIQGRAIFSIQYDFKLKNEHYYSIGDFSKWVPIPPLQLSIFVLPNEITIRSPDKQYVEVTVETNNTFLPSNISLGMEKAQGLSIENLTRLQQPFPTNGIIKFPLLVGYNDKYSVTNDHYDKIPITLTLNSYPYLFHNQKVPTAPIFAKSYMTLLLLRQLTTYEWITTNLSNFAQSFGGIVAMIIAIAGAIFGIWKWGSKKKEDKEKEFKKVEKVYCKYCGNLIPLRGIYCTSCGRKSE